MSDVEGGPSKPGDALLVVGNFEHKAKLQLGVAASDAGLSLHVAGSQKEAATWLAANDPRAMLVDASLEGAERICVDVRAESRLAWLPIVLLVREIGELAFADTYAWGADDAVEATELRPLTARLRALPRERVAAPATRGTALIADQSRDRRVVLARVLGRAGFEVAFALDAVETERRAADPAVSLVVASAALQLSARTMLDGARNAGSKAAWLVTCAPRDLGTERTALAGAERAGVVDAFAPPESVLFLANELARGAGPDNRTSARVLYGTSVAFRGAGRDRDDVGYSYNVSAAGLYVRTLTPPDDELAWIELEPPRAGRRVRFEARVRWRRKLGAESVATAPPGFGVEIADGASRDLGAWRDGYRAFVAALGG